MAHKRPQTHNHKTREDVILVIRCWYLRQDNEDRIFLDKKQEWERDDTDERDSYET